MAKFEVVKNAGTPPSSRGRHKGVRGETALAILALNPGEALRFTVEKNEVFKKVYTRLSATRRSLPEPKQFTVRKWGENAIGIWRLTMEPVAEVHGESPKAMGKKDKKSPVKPAKKNGKVEYETDPAQYSSRNCKLCRSHVPLALNHKEHIQNLEIGYSNPSNIVPCQHN